MNLNKMALNICIKEGGEINLPISQIKEVMRLHLIELAEEYIRTPSNVGKLLEKVAKENDLYNELFG